VKGLISHRQNPVDICQFVDPFPCFEKFLRTSLTRKPQKKVKNYAFITDQNGQLVSASLSLFYRNDGMSQGDTGLVATLGQITNELAVLRIEDAAALGSVTATLYDLLQQDTAISPEFHTLLQYMIASLQVVQQRQGDPHRLLEAIQAAAMMAEQLVMPPNVGNYTIFLEETMHELSQLLTETSDVPSSVAEDESLDTSSLDDIAALLVQLEPTDTEGVTTDFLRPDASDYYG
jgi:hypothetical protein